jgi:hypothetical protein
MTLTELFKSDPGLYNTDKGDEAHSFSGKSYLDRYEHHFESIRDQPGDVLEIGVSFGGSIRLWRDFFTKGSVVGFDLRDLSEFQKSEGRIKIVQGDQSNLSDLNKFYDSMFKLVIDDGSHKAEDILLSFHHLWPKVLPGGWYVMEDLRLPIDWGSYWMLEEEFRGIQFHLDKMNGDIQAVLHYPMVTMIQKSA